MRKGIYSSVSMDLLNLDLACCETKTNGYGYLMIQQYTTTTHAQRNS